MTIKCRNEWYIYAISCLHICISIFLVCRTLGIPARSVTNFASAHDTDESITIDKIYDGEGDELDSTDSIW